MDKLDLVQLPVTAAARMLQSALLTAFIVAFPRAGDAADYVPPCLRGYCCTFYVDIELGSFRPGRLVACDVRCESMQKVVPFWQKMNLLRGSLPSPNGGVPPPHRRLLGHRELPGAPGQVGHGPGLPHPGAILPTLPGGRVHVCL